MFGSIDSNTGNTEINQMVEIARNCIPNVVQFPIEISQTDQEAVSYIVWVIIVIYGTWGERLLSIDQFEFII